MIYVFVLTVGLIAGVLSGIVGTGSSIMLLPVLAYAFGPKQAVPIMAIAAIMANLSRIMAWWREVDWRAVAAYSIPGVPAAALGARTLLVLPSHTVDIAIGVFLISMIPLRRWLAVRNFTLPLWSMAVVGAVAGYLTGIVASTGPMTVPIFMSYGLVKGALLGTEAASSLLVYISKAITFRRFDAMPFDVLLKGLIAGSSLFAGAFVAKRFVLRLDPESFRLLMDGLMLVAGLSMLWSAFQG
ncbi:MAG: sulfite exporter TauE/SafE family protein [Afipia sp.]|nr:sulfite exporter TauE/SafE family protein [Afipia sp.]